MIRGLLFAAVVLLAMPAQAVEPSDVLRNAVEEVIRPGFSQLAGEAVSLEINLERLCGEPSEAALETARNQFRSTVTAWSRVEFLRFGPLMEQNRAERMFFWPDRRGIGLRQVQTILAEDDETATELASLQQKSVAVQGLGAMEFVLFGTDSERLATIEADFRCRYAETIGEALVAVAAELSAAWDDPAGVAARLSAPRAENADYRTETESLEELVSAMAFGLEALRDTKLLPFLGREGEAPKPKSAPFWRSGLTVPSLRVGFSGIFELFVKSGVAGAVDEENAWIGNSVAFEARNVERAGAAVTLPLDQALEDPAQKRALAYLGILSSSVQTMIGENLSAALGLSTGFSSLDGD